MNTLEGNKLIAEFMGYEQDFGKEFSFKIGGVWHPGRTLLYHISWDWIMMVVEKIEKEHLAIVSIETAQVFMQAFTTDTMIGVIPKTQVFDTVPKIQMVWESVIAFIQWYNSQSKTDNK